MRSMIIPGIVVLAGIPCAQAADNSVIVMLGKGVQIYGCLPVGPGYAWRLKAPDAVLSDVQGRTVGRHFAGPSWQAEDGSTVVGLPLVSSQAPQEGTIPWLVLTAKSHAGVGLFAAVSYIVRSATEGGAVPTGGCDQTHVNEETRVGYSATYTFFLG